MYEGRLDGKRVAIKKPILSTSDDLDKFHRELQILWLVPLFLSLALFTFNGSLFLFFFFFFFFVISIDDNGCVFFFNFL